ncbi:hypothetical protein O3M35_005497 [Rhynocoris fuscipes]|uniref:Uncharacterized protein n=1 Tax=Rhynocoris fuscipes TaxID=488301 RepID=A0AAW1DL37_9HEMI
MEISNYCSAIQSTERSINESQVNKLSYIKSLVNIIKVLKGREFFLLLKSQAGIRQLEGVEDMFPGEGISYLQGIQKLLTHLIKHYIMLNELHGDMLYDFSVKFPITKNISHPMLELKKNTLDYSLKINDEIQTEKQFISQLIESNERWCSLEDGFNESLDIHQQQTQNTNARDQAKLHAKKMKKLHQIKEGYEMIWRIMSIHKIDYHKEEEFRNIFYRINKAQNSSLLNISEIDSF